MFPRAMLNRKTPTHITPTAATSRPLARLSMCESKKLPKRLHTGVVKRSLELSAIFVRKTKRKHPSPLCIIGALASRAALDKKTTKVFASVMSLDPFEQLRMGRWLDYKGILESTSSSSP